MDYFERHIARVENAMEEMELQPDRVIHEAYYAYALHDCAGLADLTDAERDVLKHNVELACVGVVCPPLAVGSAGNQVYLLLQGHLEISADGIAQAAGATLPRWSGVYSVVSLGKDEAEDMAPAFLNADPAVRDLFVDLEDEDQDQWL